MYIILVYDCGEKRVGKMLKLCRKYLNWVQNSVFEGEISATKLKELSMELEKLVRDEKDSVIIYQIRQEKWVKRSFIGKQEDKTDNFF